MTTDPESSKAVEELLGINADDVSAHHIKVVESIASSEPIAENINDVYEESLSFGDRLADRVASFGGSWTFILLFGFFMLIWITTNTLLLVANDAFDPYPFILLNLGLSTIAALQAPIIMMSQNRQGIKDRLKADQNYEVSLKTDLEIIRLHTKIDELSSQLDAMKKS